MHRFNDVRIDADHDLIISSFDALCGIVSAVDYDARARRELIESARRYTTEHFRSEEAHMRAVGYPDLQEHSLAHAYMGNEFERLLGTMAPDRPNLAADARLLRQVFLTHILTHDEAYAEWLASRPAPVTG